MLDITSQLIEEIGSRESDDPFIQEVMVYLSLHISEKIRLDVLCIQFATNRTTLNQRFRKVTGLTVMEYLLEKRISLAKSDLAFTDLPVAEIAERVGIPEPTYFGRVFLKKVGCTPLTFRRKSREQRPA